MDWITGYAIGFMMNLFLFAVLFNQKNGKIRVGLLCYIGGYCAGIFLRILLTWVEVEISAINWCVIFVTNFGSLAACAVFISYLWDKKSKDNHPVSP